MKGIYHYYLTSYKKSSSEPLWCCHEPLALAIPQYLSDLIKVANSTTQKREVRLEWKINMKRTAQIEYVFALYKNVIVEVYKPTEWYVNLRTGRLMFEGELAPIEVRQACINQYLSAVEGVRGPVIYNF